MKKPDGVFFKASYQKTQKTTTSFMHTLKLFFRDRQG